MQQTDTELMVISLIEQLKNELQNTQLELKKTKNELQNIKNKQINIKVICCKTPELLNEIFIENKEWGPVSVNKNKINDIKYVAIYVSKPIQKIEYYGIVQSYQCHDKKYKFKFSKIIRLDNPIKYNGHVYQSLYTNFEKLNNAIFLEDLI